MDKDFEGWNLKKQNLHFENKEIPFWNEREIWWSSLGVNIGQEQDGKHNEFERPVLILKKFNKEILWTLPITSIIKKEIFYYSIKYGEENRSVILSQLRLISSKRLLRKIDAISAHDFREIKWRVLRLLI